jgi:hypothetical protein
VGAAEGGRKHVGQCGIAPQHRYLSLSLT